MRPTARRGFTLAEVLVALLVGLLVGQLVLSTARWVRTAHRAVLRDVEILGSYRLAAELLRTELRSGARGLDWDVEGDSLWLRAYRGTGLICPERSGPDIVEVSYRGYRQPDPVKDSVVILDASGGARVYALEAVTPGPAICAGVPLDGGLTLRLGVGIPGIPVVARIFERGAYSVTRGTLRYRRGAGGRQPLGPEIWEAGSGWRMSGGGLALELLGGAESGGAWRLALTPEGSS